MDISWALGAALANGALVGLLPGVFGGGGSVLATPLLIYAVGVRDPHVAIGASAAAVAANALAGLAVQARAGRVKWPCALVAGGAVGVLASGPVAGALSDRADLARRLFALMVIAVAAYVAFRALT